MLGEGIDSIKYQKAVENMNTKTTLRFSLLAVFVLGLLFLSVQPGGAAGEGRPLAATYRTWIAQVPSGNPVSGQSVRVWINSDTAPGETAGLEYKIGSTYTKVLGTYDTSYPGANWRVDIPGQASGIFVEYQLFTRNEGGSDYGFTGFNWSYTVYGPNCDISWAQVLHDSFNLDYRSPSGPIAAGATQVKLRLRVAQDELSSARVRVWNDRTNTETYYNMAWDGTFDSDPATYDYWYVDIPLPTDPTILYYFFELNDNGNGVCPSGYSADQDFYSDYDVKFYGGGYGAMYDTNSGVDQASYQITVYDSAFTVPEWFQRGVVYQIFPDRFRDGDPSNDPAAGRFFYDQSGGTVARSGEMDWNTAICDPRSAACPGVYSQNFYGGDLAGITEKINAGYFDQLGVSVLYLNPIFRSPSNHKYDTADYLTIDPDFGSLSDFQALAAAAEAHDIKLILDGVFNHTSSDSTYFDLYSRYDSSGTLTSPGGAGADDDSGACEAGSSPYYGWYYFPAGSNPSPDQCANGAGDALQTYEAWYGYSSLPKLQADSAAVRSLVWDNGSSSVGPYWIGQGASGWRFDVGGDVDPGLANDPSNGYWEGFRSAVRTVDASAITLGEEWGDASAWLLGSEWDSVMNYRYRSAVLSWLFTGCSGDGCMGGSVFEDNDSNAGSSSGPIAYVSPSQLNARLRSIQEDYPPMAWKAMMNLGGSHDTNRTRFLLKKINNDNDSAALQRMKELWLFAFTYAGAPTLYYGDEIGLSQDGVFSGGKYEDDPYNRAPFPWDDTPGDFSADTALQGFMRRMSSIRSSYRALQDGDVQHGLVIDDPNKVYGFARTNASQTAIILLNRDSASHSVTLNGLNAAPYSLTDGTVLLDVIEGNTYTVTGGSVTVPVNPTWGVVLLERDEIETPAAPASPATQFDASGVTLAWDLVSTDTGGGREVPTSYTVHRSAASPFTPDETNRIATVDPPAYGVANARLTYTDEAAAGTEAYAVCAVNAGGKSSCAFAATQCTADTSLYRSAASGPWTDSAAWEVSSNGGVDWSAAGCWPTSGNGAIQVQSGHTLTLDSALTVDQATIAAGGQVTVGSGVTLTVANGTGIDLTVDGTLSNAGALTMSGTSYFGAGSLYQHDRDGGILPTAAWNAASTVLVTGVVDTAPSGLGQSFGNFSWDGAGQTGAVNLTGNLTAVNGDLTVASTGSGSLALTDVTDFTLNIGGDLTLSSGLLEMTSGAVSPAINVDGDVILNGGTLDAGPGGISSFAVTGNWTNNGGTFDPRFSTVTFTGTAAQVIEGSASTTFYGLRVDKGSSKNNLLEATGPMDMLGQLTLLNGTFKLTHPNAAAQFTSGPTIPSSAGLWINGGTLRSGDFSTTNNGLIRVSAGTANFGTGSGNSINAGSGANFIIEGGTLNVAGRLRATSSITYNQSGGTVNVAAVGQGSSNNGSFDLSSTSTSFTMSGGTIVLVQANTTTGTKIDYRLSAASPTITGGILQVGNGSTVANSTFRLIGQMPSLTVDNTNNAKTALLIGVATINDDVTIQPGTTLDSGDFGLAIKGDWSNNGAFAQGTATATFNGSAPQTIGGSGSTIFNNLTVNNASGVTLEADQTVNGVLAFTDGKLTTGANALVLGTGGSVSGAGAGKYVYGNLRKTFSSGASQTFKFEIGDADSYTPAELANFDVTVAGTLTASVTPGRHPEFISADIGDKYVNRYWTLTPAGGLGTSSYDITLTFVPGDLVGSPDTNNLVVQKYTPTTWSSPVSSSSTATTVTGTGFASFSDFFAGEGGVPTPVTVSYFRAERDGDTVTFEWSTATESGNVGFNLYVEKDGERLQLNDELIPSAQTDSLDRQDYTFSAEADGETFYVEDISVLGRTRLHGPFSLGQDYGDRQEADQIDWAAVRSGSRFANPELSVTPGDPARLILKVEQTGLYRIGYEALRRAGLDLAGVRADRIRLSSQGQVTPIRVNGKSVFGPGSSIEFYGEALDSLYTDANVYTLQVARAGSPAVEVDRSAPSKRIRTPLAYAETLVVDTPRAYANYAPGEDAWYAASMLAYTSPKSWNFDFEVDGLADPNGSARLELVVWGVTDWPQTPDHHLRVSLNGVSLADELFDGLVEKTLSLSLPAGTLREGTNTLTLSLPGDTGAQWDMVNLDRYSLTYRRVFAAREGQLTFTAKARMFKVTDLPGRNVVVYRLGADGPVRLAKVVVQAEGGAYSATFVGTGELDTYLVTVAGQMKAPRLETVPVREPDLKSPARFLIIAHPDFIAGVEPLAQARRSEGLSVRVVDVNDLYARYSYGIFDPQAIKTYIGYAYENLGTEYVLLVGGDTYDYHDYLGRGSISFIPSLYATTGAIAKFVPADPLYADVDGDNLPDLAIGRFPVRTAAELEMVVQKTLAYGAKDYGQTAVFASDQHDGVVSFKKISERLAAGMPDGWAVESLHLDDLGVVTARTRLLEAMNRGAALVTFTGHSGPAAWTFSGLFNTSHATGLTNVGRPFVAVQWGCWNTYYVDPVNNYLVQSLLFSGDKGAAAVLGASTLTESSSEALLGGLLTPRLAAPGLRIGQALQEAKLELAQTHPTLLDVLLGWTLMGDPTLTVDP